MALQEDVEINKKNILSKVRLHNNKIEDRISVLENAATNIERDIYYEKIRLSKIENEIMETRENLITIKITI